MMGFALPVPTRSEPWLGFGCSSSRKKAEHSIIFLSQESHTSAINEDQPATKGDLKELERDLKQFIVERRSSDSTIRHRSSSYLLLWNPCNHVVHVIALHFINAPAPRNDAFWGRGPS